MIRVNPLDGLALRGTPYEQELVIRGLLAGPARQMRKTFESIEEFDAVDAMGLTRIGISRMVQGALYLRGKAITTVIVNRCICISLRATAETFDLDPPVFMWTVPLGDMLEEWATCVDEDLRRGAQGKRLQALQFLTRSIRDQFGPERDFEQFERAGRAAMRRLRMDQNEAGGPERVGRIEVLSTLSLFRRSTPGTPGGIFRGRNGKVQLSATDVRDVISRELEISREPDPFDPQRHPLDKILPTESRTASVPATAHDRDFAAAMLAYQASAVAAAATPKKKAVLGFLTDRFLEDMAETEIAQRVGVDPAFVNRTLRAAGADFGRTIHDEF